MLRGGDWSGAGYDFTKIKNPSQLRTLTAKTQIEALSGVFHVYERQIRKSFINSNLFLDTDLDRILQLYPTDTQTLSATFLFSPVGGGATQANGMLGFVPQGGRLSYGLV
jgi:hypothetical protein